VQTVNSRLEEARLHVAQGEQRIADQQLRIVDLRMRDADTTSALSRDHSVVPGPDGMITIVGGKYTTYRLMAQDAVDAAATAGLPGDVPASLTKQTALLGADGWAALRNRTGALAREYGLRAEQMERLLGRYGNRIHDVLAVGVDDPSLLRPRADWADYLPAELIYAHSTA